MARLYALSTIVFRYGRNGLETHNHLGYRMAETEEEATNMFWMHVKDESPGWKMQKIICIEILEKHLRIVLDSNKT